MSIQKKVKKCAHCGTILQNFDEKKDGYISQSVLDSYPDGVLLCNKCFAEEKRTNNEIVLNDQFKTILNGIKLSNSLVVYVIDLFSFEGGFSSETTEFLASNDIIAVANKRDLLPEYANDEDLKKYVEHRLKMAKLKVKDVFLTSSNTGYHIQELKQALENYSQGKDIYFIGSKNSGKTTLIEEIIKNYNNDTGKLIITYNFPGTELRGFRIPLTNKTYIYDIPGFPIYNSMLEVLEKSTANQLVPKKAVEDVKFNMTERIGAAIGGVAFVQLLKGERTVLHCFFSKKIFVKGKLGDPVKFFSQVLQNKEQKVMSYKYNNLKDFDVYDFEITEKGPRDLGILGLGWMQFDGNGQIFRVYVPKGVYVFTTRAKLKNVKQ